MTAPAQKPPGTGGGSIAIRGFLVQTLVSLLEAAQADPPCIEITLEPTVGHEQFDFIWKNSEGTHATQVKSTCTTFAKSDAEAWAAKLEAVRSVEDCRLVLVGNIPRSLDGIDQIGAVKIEKRNLHLADLHEQAAQRLAKFLEAEGMPAGTGLQREMVVHALVSKLEHLAENSTLLSREAFLKLLRDWIRTAPKGEVRVDLSHFNILKYAPVELIGRKNETKTLCDAWLQAVHGEPNRPHIITFVALGGEGKTSLVATWAADLAEKDWSGCDTAFAWSFYSQGTREQLAASSDLFLKAALNFFGDEEDRQFAASKAGAFEKGLRLAQIVSKRRALLILDGLEPLQYSLTSSPPGELKDQGLAALLRGLANFSQGMCVITTRYSIPDLKVFKDKTVLEKELKSLSREAGVQLLQKLGVKGSLFRNIPFNDGKEKVNEFEKLVEDVKGHALTLNLLGTFLRDAHAGDIRKRVLVNLEEADAEEQGGHAFRVMDAYVKWFETGGKTAEENQKGQRALALLRLLGLFDRPATADCLDALWKGDAIPGLTKPFIGMSEAQRNMALTQLESAKLLTVNRNKAGTLISLDAHSLLRDYFAVRLRDGSFWPSIFWKLLHRMFPRVSSASPAWRAAHRRLYEHLCKTTSDKKPYPTLEDLQPLYQAVAHGCQAGLQQEAYHKLYMPRLVRGNEYYSPNKIGAYGDDLGAVACFFEQPFRRISPSLTEVDQAWLWNEASHCHRALGLLGEALKLSNEGVTVAKRSKNWNIAAICARGLSEVELTLGKVADAVRDAKQSVSFADKDKSHTEDALFQKVNCRARLGDALHQAGYHAAARKPFKEFRDKRKNVPDSSGLSTVNDFQYCDLHLSEAERSAWCHYLQLKTSHELQNVFACNSDYQVAKKMLAEQPSAIALDRLTVVRAALYPAIVEQSEIVNLQSEIEGAMAGLRDAGRTDRIPLGLLTRAWLRFLTDARTGPERAQADLDDAWEIAERGPMRLFMADIHLYRARLFGLRNTDCRLRIKDAKYPWESPQADLAAAEKLINNCGYHRRNEELADAKKALLS